MSYTNVWKKDRKSCVCLDLQPYNCLTTMHLSFLMFVSLTTPIPALIYFLQEEVTDHLLQERLKILTVQDRTSLGTADRKSG